MSVAIKLFLEKHAVANSSLYAIPSEVFNGLDVKSWRFNRPPDLSRVEDIRAWMASSGRMDGVLNLAYVPGQGLVCYEGNHRRLAVAGLGGITVLAGVMWDATDESIIAEFRRLNKSISVPDLYVIEDSMILRGEIETAVSEFRKRFHAMESNSGRPQRPHFNRDKLTDEISRIQKELGIPVSSVMARLGELNHQYSIQSHAGLSEKIAKKCADSGLWLFARSTSIASNELMD